MEINNYFNFFTIFSCAHLVSRGTATLRGVLPVEVQPVETVLLDEFVKFGDQSRSQGRVRHHRGEGR